MSKKKLRRAMKDLRDILVDLDVPSALDYKNMNSYQLMKNKDTLLYNLDNYLLDLDLSGVTLSNKQIIDINYALDGVDKYVS